MERYAGDRIPLEARIGALADVYESITKERPGKRLSPHRTIATINPQ